MNIMKTYVKIFLIIFSFLRSEMIEFSTFKELPEQNYVETQTFSVNKPVKIRVQVQEEPSDDR